MKNCICSFAMSLSPLAALPNAKTSSWWAMMVMVRRWRRTAGSDPCAETWTLASSSLKLSCPPKMSSTGSTWLSSWRSRRQKSRLHKNMCLFPKKKPNSITQDLWVENQDPTLEIILLILFLAGCNKNIWINMQKTPSWLKKFLKSPRYNKDRQALILGNLLIYTLLQIDCKQIFLFFLKCKWLIFLHIPYTSMCTWFNTLFFIYKKVGNWVKP